MNQPESIALPRQRGFLGWVERVGNLLPEPTMIFVYLIGALMVLSTIGAALGWSASLAYIGEIAPTGAVLADGAITYHATSLFSSENIALLLVEMPRTMAGFAPLGLILVVMLGAAVAERSGLFSGLIRASLRNAPKAALTPIVALIGMVSHHASDAAYVVYIPLAAIVFAAAGRHPLGPPQPAGGRYPSAVGCVRGV